MEYNDEFLESIKTDQNLVADYHSKLNSGIKGIKSQFRSEKKKRKASLQQEIELYEEHDSLVDMAIFPFVQSTNLSTKMGYKLISCDPLYEKNIPNFDAMIGRVTDKEIRAILIEAKTSDRHFKSEVDDTINKQKLCEKYSQYVGRTYFKSDMHINFEYVICTYPRFVDRLQDAIEQNFSDTTDKDIKNRKIIVWKIDPWESILSIASPGRENVLKRRMLHDDNNLNSELGKDLEVSKRNFTFFPQSHSVTKIKGIVEMMVRIKVITGKTEFHIDELRNYFSNTLFYLNMERRDKILSSTLELGKKIGLLHEVDVGRYDVVKTFSGSSLRPQTVEKLWIDNRMEEELSKKMDGFTSDLRSKIKLLYANTPKLDDYLPK